MSDCTGCANPSGGLVVRGCRQCCLRDLAAGPLFWKSMLTGRLTPEYRAALQGLGDDVLSVHAEVKAAAKTVFMGSVNA